MNRIFRPARVVIAPDSFKGSATASVAAATIADGWRELRPHDDVQTIPLADGGEGTVDVVAAAQGRAAERVRVAGPAGRDVVASWLRSDEVGLVELASASGLTLLDRPAPWTSHTFGFGQVIAAALRAGCARLELALGGSASTDGGMGALTALGARFLDARGHPVPLGAQGLLDLAEVDLSGLAALPPGGVEILADVESPAVGASGAAAVYGPQKGLPAADVERLDDALSRLALVLRVDPHEPGTGAAGAAALGLRAWGATTSSGAARIADRVGLPHALRSADLVVTGEGRFDSQTASGKAAGYVSEAATQHGLPVALVAGSIDVTPVGYVDAVSLTALAGSSEQAMGDPKTWLRAAGRRLAGRFGAVLAR